MTSTTSKGSLDYDLDDTIYGNVFLIDIRKRLV